MRLRFTTALPLLAACAVLASCAAFAAFAGCVTAHRPPPDPVPVPEPPFQSVSYRARVAADSEPGTAPRWTDVVIDGSGREQRRACALAVASELRAITVTPGAKGSVIRDCAPEPLPRPPAPGAPGVVLVESRAAGDELRAEATVVQAEALPETLRARIATFTRLPSPEACAEARARSQGKRSEIALRKGNEAFERAQRELTAAQAERDAVCANQRAVAAQCDALPAAGDLAAACKSGQGSRRCHSARQQARASQRCESGLRAAKHECERTAGVVEEARKRLPAGPRKPSGDPPICQPG